MGNLFGTDGVRGIANTELSPELAFAVGRAGASWASRKYRSAVIALGRDTRISSDMLSCAVAAGIMSSGGTVLDLGIMPTPAIAFLTRDLKADAGVVISASHNPVEYNGIKFFSKEGFKLSIKDEEEITGLVEKSGWPSGNDSLPRPTASGIGRMRQISDAEDRYIDFVKGFAPDLTGLRIVVDCANGASYRITPRVLAELGATVIPINSNPDGLNINVGCGSTHPEAASAAVRRYGADVGLTHDGDADRLIAIDENGNVVDGDHIIAICGLDLLRRGMLPQKAVVATVYSNLGLIDAFRREGGDVIATKAGDRYVFEEMRNRGIILGGEQSGHIIFLNQSTTGDGLITALNLLKVLVSSGRPLSSLAGQMMTYPQLLVNVKVSDRERFLSNPRVSQAVRDAEERLKGSGRIFVRPSGTEPLIRILGEGPDSDLVHEVVHGLAGVIREECG
ncbi:MAG: phosphoglucosamine mutase [Firmicutes bacterium]|nr:phosphoglucosamine mutase [Bacillota bacterium]